MSFVKPTSGFGNVVALHNKLCVKKLYFEPNL